jgi:predicted GIY-YIG superfamily endonuclease
MSAALSGHVYLVCFDRAIGDPANPKGSASHYLGWAEDVEARMAEHRAGRGARILAACIQRGIAFDVVRTWAGVDRNFERRLKRQHNAWRHCPRCGCRRSRAGPGQPVAARSGAGPTP